MPDRALVHATPGSQGKLLLPHIEVQDCRAVVELVDRMLELQKSLPQAKTDHEKTLIERQIKTTDNQIDKLVYELYALSDDEIAIVEGAE